MKTLLIVLGCFLLSFDMFCQSKIENDIFNELNRVRKYSANLKPVKYSDAFKNRTMNHNNSIYFSMCDTTLNDSIHYEFVENDTIQKFFSVEERYDDNGIGEIVYHSKNINKNTGENIISVFMSSIGHKNIILDKKYNNISISVNEYLSEDNKIIIIATLFLYTVSEKYEKEKLDKKFLDEHNNKNNIKIVIKTP